MKVIYHINNAKDTLISFEILPPLKGKGIEALYNHLDPLMEYKPAFINVTYHRSEHIFKKNPDGSFKKVPQIGNVVVEDYVEIGANVTIDRATIGSTIIRTGAKLDNLIQIAHNVEVGHHTVIAAQAGISGSTKIGNQVMIGGQAGIVGHLQIADGARINAQSGVSKSIKIPGAAVTGTPAFDYTSALRSQALSRNLPELEKRLKELEELVRQLLAEKV